MEKQQPEEDFSTESFIEKPAILDKYKAAALVANCKCICHCQSGFNQSIREMCSRSRYRWIVWVWRQPDHWRSKALFI
jgi:hypothetical protein